MPKQLSDLSPALQDEARRLLADPALVSAWHAFLDKHDIACVRVFSDDFGQLWLRDQDGTSHRLTMTTM